MGKLKYIFTPQRLAIHKIRFDRGGMYLGYLTGFGMATILVKIFNIKSWWFYALGIFLIIAYRYIAGYVDEKKQILKKEQGRYADVNPWNDMIIAKIDTLNSKLDVLLKENSEKD
jgi:hypothetical protein